MSPIKNLLTNTEKSSQMIKPCEPRMYLILREDLAYKYIQGGHALAAFALGYPDEFEEWDNQYLICLSVFNGLALKDVLTMLNDSTVGDLPFEEFYEPDLQSELPTAICIFEDGTGEVAHILKGLQLATK